MVVAGRVIGGTLRIVGTTTPFGSSRDKVKLVQVEPTLVAEVLADAALQAGGYRHPLRYVRTRLDLSPDDLNCQMP